ncbi:MAG: NAD-dependent epimerase/dehydratase family protein [Candidatus Omnitrophica bacterium]|nr:NAD-dependent epimerase/dehydratase family protein [Candidatus Omnitrophota bacterium]
MVSLKGESIVIFGGSGFIGSHLAERLVNLGAKVTVADKDAPSAFFGGIIRKVGFEKTNILKKDDLKPLLRKSKYVFNLAAALPFSGKTDDYLSSCINVNIQGAANIASMAKEAGVKKLVFISGYVVYGIPEYLPMDEKHPTNPIDFYGASKLAAEKYLEVICRQAPGLSLVILRLSSVYGPRQISQGLIPNLMRASISNSNIVINARGQEKRDYVYINDAVDALILSLKDDAAGVFNVGNNQSVSANQIIEIIEKLSGRSFRIKYRNNKSPISEVILSNKRAWKYLSYQPKVSIKDGLALTYQWFKNNYAGKNK